MTPSAASAGLTLYGAGMHYDPLISSRSKALVSWGHDWVVLCLIIVHPFWAPTKVFALPIAARLYSNRQGLTKGKKRPRTAKATSQAQGAPRTQADPDHRTRPELALELIHLAARWFPDDEIIVTGDSAYGGQKRPVAPAPQRPSHQPCPSQGGALQAGASQGPEGTKGGPARKGIVCPA